MTTQKYKVLNAKGLSVILKKTSFLKQALDAVLFDDTVIKATKYVSPKEIIRVVRRTFKANGKKPRVGENIEMTVTIGKPNYQERDFIKLCQKAKEPFPVKLIQLKHVPVKKATKNLKTKAKKK